jgi:hypothetical protein
VRCIHLLLVGEDLIKTTLSVLIGVISMTTLEALELRLEQY